MINLEQAIKELDDIISKNIDVYKFPEVKGKSIRIGKILIRASKTHGYVVFDIEQNKSINAIYSKSGAIAFALAYQKNGNSKKILYYDAVIEKNANDSRFYYHTIKNSTEPVRKSAILNRFEESKHKINWAKDALDEYIINDIR